VDLVPRKVCSYDCVYCQLGRTTRLTVDRSPFVDPQRVAAEVEQALARGPRPEVITLAGSGEPTLCDDLEQVVAELRRVTDLPLCLLTNGGLLWQEPVARAAFALDLVAPSLDAADEQTYRRINRPHESIDFSTMLAGLRDFCRRFEGRCQLEVMLVAGINDSAAALDALARLVSSLEVDSVDLNSVMRPPAEAGVTGLDPDGLERALVRFASCPARVIVPFDSRSGAEQVDRGRTRERILETVARRPCTVSDLSTALGAPVELVRTLCRAAVKAKELTEEPSSGGEPYYLRR